MSKLQFIISSLFKKNRKEVLSEKSLIRQNIWHKKQHISEMEKEIEAEEVFEKIESLPEFQAANAVLMYWSLPDELPTHNFIIKWSKKKQMLLPVVKEDEMLIKPFLTKDEMTQGSLGIWEPSVQKEYINKIDLVIVPGVAFDKNKSRLGRGKGFYDKYFVNRHIIKIGIGFDFQLIEKVPTDAYDIKMDKIITKSRIIE